MEQQTSCKGQCYCSGKCKKPITLDNTPIDFKAIFEKLEVKEQAEEQEDFFKPIL